MTEGECLSVYDQLGDMLRESELGWIFEQVDGELRLGKHEAKELVKSRRGKQDSGLEYDLVDAKNKTSTKVFQQTVPYTPHERLRMLISGIRNSVITAIGLQEQILSSLGQDRKNIQVRFASEDGNVREYTVESVDVDQLSPNGEVLTMLLNQLEGEI